MKLSPIFALTLCIGTVTHTAQFVEKRLTAIAKHCNGDSYRFSILISAEGTFKISVQEGESLPPGLIEAVSASIQKRLSAMQSMHTLLATARLVSLMGERPALPVINIPSTAPASYPDESGSDFWYYPPLVTYFLVPYLQKNKLGNKHKSMPPTGTQKPQKRFKRVCQPQIKTKQRSSKTHMRMQLKQQQ